MTISFTNINFNQDIDLPEYIENLNQDIINICKNLPALNIVRND